MKALIFAMVAIVVFPMVAVLAAGESNASNRPNLVLILADDLGYGDPSCYGGKLVPTPAIDSLARDGVRCTDGYVTAPVCAPSRCGIMTGSYNERFGIQWNDDHDNYNVGRHKLLPQALRAAGYLAGHVGKWNIGADIAGCFDETYDVIDWEADYFPTPEGCYFGVNKVPVSIPRKVLSGWGPERPGEEYLTDRLGRHAVEFIEKHKRRPFFLYLAFNAVHSPWQAKAADRQRFAQIKPEVLGYYASMVASLDENVGWVLAKLKSEGLEENTLVVFASDNGPALGCPAPTVWVWPERWPKAVVVGSAGPLRGHKTQFFEGGIREPFILRWPARLKAGGVYRRPVSTMDIYPTFCAAAGATMPQDTRLDGVDLLPHLRGENAAPPHAILFWKNGPQGAVRQGDWKLVLNAMSPKLQLFNLARDVGEKHDRAADQPELLQRLHKAWLDWSATLPPCAAPAHSGSVDQKSAS